MSVRVDSVGYYSDVLPLCLKVEELEQALDSAYAALRDFAEWLDSFADIDSLRKLYDEHAPAIAAARARITHP